MRKKGPFDFNVAEMTPEEVIEKLRAAGIPVNSWVDNEETCPPEGKKVRLPSFEKHAELLGHIRDLMQQQVDQDVSQIDELNYQLKRLRHGGGR